MVQFGTILIVLLLLSTVSVLFAQTASDSLRSGPGTYKILSSGKTEITIPFRMLNGKPVMECKINGKQANLMIDNGRLWDEVWLFGTPLIDELALPIEEGVGHIGGAGTGNPTQAILANDLTLTFKDIEFYGQNALISPASAGFAEMFKGTDGQLCNTFFTHFIVEFDFTKSVIVLHKPDSFKYKGNGVILDMKLENTGAYSIPVSFILENDSMYKGRADIDLGGIHMLLVGLNNANNIEVPAGAKVRKSYGAQGECTDYESTIKEFSVGTHRIESPAVTFSDAKISSLSDNNLGIVGLDFFMRYNTIFDYKNNLLYLTSQE